MRRLLVLPAVLLAALVAPAAAGAATYCVPAEFQGCSGTEAATIQAAFDAAEASAEDDTVLIGAGQSFAPALYAPAAGTTRGTLTVAGRGPALTTIVGNTDQDGLEMRRDTVGSLTTVKDLRVIAGDLASGVSTYGHVENVVVNAKFNSDRSAGISLYGDASATNVTVDLAELTENSNHTGIYIGDANTEVTTGARVLGATIVGADTGISVLYPARIARSHVVSRGMALVAYCGLTFVDDVFLKTVGLGSSPVVIATATCDDNALVKVNHATIIGREAINNPGAFRFPSGGGLGQADVTNSVVAGTYPLAYGFGGAAKINVSHSVVPTLAVDGVGFEDKGGTIVGDPLFGDPANGDFSLRWPSPAIDAGSTAPLSADEPATDLAGAPRIADGDGDGVARRDAGAFEYYGPRAKLAGPASANVGQAVTFDAGASSAHAGPITLAWSFGDGGTAGNVKQVEHAFSAPGTYTVSVTVTDAQDRTATQTATITVVDPNAQPPAATPTPAPPGPAPTPGPAADVIDPALSGVKWAKSRFKARKGSVLRWRLSEPARLVLRFERCTRKRGKRCARWSRVAARSIAAKAGPGSLKVARKVGRKPMRRGAWRVRVHATDAAGNASAERVATFRVT